MWKILSDFQSESSRLSVPKSTLCPPETLHSHTGSGGVRSPGLTGPGGRLPGARAVPRVPLALGLPLRSPAAPPAPAAGAGTHRAPLPSPASAGLRLPAAAELRARPSRQEQAEHGPRDTARSRPGDTDSGPCGRCPAPSSATSGAAWGMPGCQWHFKNYCYCNHHHHQFFKCTAMINIAKYFFYEFRLLFSLH